MVSELDELDRRLAANRALVQGETDSERFFVLMTLVVVASDPMDEELGWEQLASGELLHIGPDLELHRETILSAPPRKPLSLSGRAADSQAQEH